MLRIHFLPFFFLSNFLEFESNEGRIRIRSFLKKKDGPDPAKKHFESAQLHCLRFTLKLKSLQQWKGETFISVHE